MKEVIMKVPSFSADYPKTPIYVADLVRRRECKYWDNEDDAQRCSYAHNGLYWAKPNDFCSYGEREGE